MLKKLRGLRVLTIDQLKAVSKTADRVQAVAMLERVRREKVDEAMKEVMAAFEAMERAVDKLQNVR